MARLLGGSGGGGSGTVSTDGVTIQGDGSGGSPIALKQVETGATLTGAGTLASTLGVTPVTRWMFGNALANTTVNANQVSVWGVYLPVPVTFANLTVNFGNVDSTNKFDVGIYSAAGALIANLGGIVFTSGSGFQTHATVQGSQTIAQGVYLVASTGNATAVNQFAGDSGQEPSSWFQNLNYTSSSGGALPNSISAPTPAFVRAIYLSVGLS